MTVDTSSVPSLPLRSLSDEPSGTVCPSESATCSTRSESPLTAATSTPAVLATTVYSAAAARRHLALLWCTHGQRRLSGRRRREHAGHQQHHDRRETADPMHRLLKNCRVRHSSSFCRHLGAATIPGSVRYPRAMVRRVAVLTLILTAELAGSASAQIASDIVVSGLRNPVAVVADPTDRCDRFSSSSRRADPRRAGRTAARRAVPRSAQRRSASGGERGLLGIALAPDFAESRRFFVNFTNRSGDTVVARFRAQRDDPLSRRPGVAIRSRLARRTPLHRPAVLESQRRASGVRARRLSLYRHGRWRQRRRSDEPCAEPAVAARQDAAASTSTCPTTTPRGYRVPDGQPVRRSTIRSRALHEIWAFGLRNPWRYSFDDWTRGGTAALVIGDVGQDAREEINFEPAGRGGRNYGWRLREGRQPYDARSARRVSAAREPIHDYGRDHRRVGHRRPGLSRRRPRSGLQRTLLLRRLRLGPCLLDRPASRPSRRGRRRTTSASTRQRLGGRARSAWSARLASITTASCWCSTTAAARSSGVVPDLTVVPAAATTARAR